MENIRSMPRNPHRQSDFADLAFRQQGVELDPILQIISDFLDSNDELIEQVRQDLQRGLKNPHTGRDGLTPAQVLRSFILRRIKNWEYRELRERIADGYTLRQFADFYTRPVPKHDAFHRAFNRLVPQTLKTINALINAIAPGWIETDMTAPVRTTPMNDEILARTPAGRWGQPEEVAGAAVYLASRASDFVTGDTIRVDGGYAIR
jgi:transposase, IS5 family